MPMRGMFAGASDISAPMARVVASANSKMKAVQPRFNGMIQRNSCMRRSCAGARGTSSRLCAAMFPARAKTDHAVIPGQPARAEPGIHTPGNLWFETIVDRGAYHDGL